MVMEPGGRADKEGNRYEVKCILSVLFINSIHLYILLKNCLIHVKKLVNYALT